MRKRTTIWLDNELIKRLRREAIDEDTTMSDIIRKAIERRNAEDLYDENELYNMYLRLSGLGANDNTEEEWERFHGLYRRRGFNPWNDIEEWVKHVAERRRTELV